MITCVVRETRLRLVWADGHQKHEFLRPHVTSVDCDVSRYLGVVDIHRRSAGLGCLRFVCSAVHISVWANDQYYGKWVDTAETCK